MTPEDALVEAVARALCSHHAGIVDVWPVDRDSYVTRFWQQFADEARAAIAAARPAIEAAAYQRAAEVAGGTQAYDDSLHTVNGLRTTGQRIAAAIRALAEVPK